MACITGMPYIIVERFEPCNALVVKDCTATACEALGVIALQMMALTLQDRRYCPEHIEVSAVNAYLFLISLHITIGEAGYV